MSVFTDHSPNRQLPIAKSGGKRRGRNLLDYVHVGLTYLPDLSKIQTNY